MWRSVRIQDIPPVIPVPHDEWEDEGVYEDGYRDISPEESAAREKIAQEQRVKIETERNLEKLRSQQWTRDDLAKLLYVQEGILDKHTFWEPQAFEDDLSLINAQIAKEKGEIKLEGIEKAKISEDGINYMYGLLIQDHVLRQDFYIEIGANNQPIIHDNHPNPDAARIEQKEGLQKALDSKEFQHDSNSWLRAHDNVPKIKTYLTAAAYHGQKEKNLIKYREQIEKKIQRNPNKPLTEEDIRNADLEAPEKTFLLMWRKRDNDAALINIQKNQDKFVENARLNFKKKSPEQHWQEIRERPVSKTIELFGAGIIGVGLLAIGLKQLLGKSGVMGKIFGTIMALIGGFMVVPMGDKAWQALGGPEMVNGLTTKRPVDRARANDNLPANAVEGVKDLWGETKEGVKNLQARIAGPEEWTLLLMNKDIGPAVTNYPAGALLYALYDGYPTERWEFSAYDKNPEMPKIQATLKKMSEAERTQLRGLMGNAWKRQKEIAPGKVADDSTLDNKDENKLTLGTMIKEIDDTDKWWNELPDWTGWRNELFTQNTAKTEALKVISPYAQAWGDVTIGDLKKYFDPAVAADWKSASRIEALLNDQRTQAMDSNADATIRRFVAWLATSDIPDTTTLRDFLAG